MKFFKYYYFAAVALLIAYVQLLALPGLRSCVLNSYGVSISAGAVKSCLGMAQLVPMLILAAMLMGLYAFRADLHAWLERKPAMIVAVISGLAALPYLSAGNVMLGDAMHFSGLTMYMKDSLLALNYPFWNFYWHMGSAVFAYYGWLYFLLSGVVNIFVGTDWTNKILFFALHIGSVLLAYKFVKTATNNSRIAVIAAIVYGLSFEHMARVMLGRSFTALTYFLTPLLFLAYETRLKNRVSNHRAIGLLALTTALLLFTHPTNAAFIIAIFLLYAFLRAESKKTAAVELGTGLLLAFVLTAFWAIPMIAESGDAGGTAKVADLLIPQLPKAEFAANIFAWPGKWGAEMHYIGLSVIGLAALGIAYLAKAGKFAVPAATAMAAMLLALQTARYAPVLILLLGVCAGYGTLQLNRKIRIDSSKLMLAVIAVLAIDLLPGTAQLGYPDFSYETEFYSKISAEEGERILDLSADRRTFWPMMPYIVNKDEAVFGPVIESAPKSLAYAAAISNKAATEYYDLRQNFSEETLQGMYLLGVKYVVLHPEQAGKNPKEVFAEKKAALGLERGLEVAELQHSPIIAAKRVSSIAYTPELDKQDGWILRLEYEDRNIDFSEIRSILAAMNIDTGSSTSEQILVKSSKNEIIAAEELALEVKDVRTSADKIEIRYETSSEAFLQLSYAHGPLSAKIDGEETEYWKSAINTVVVKSPGGEHVIAIQGKQPPLRKQLMLISLAGLLMLIYLLRKQLEERGNNGKI
ncbi:hypothetical protein HYX10_01790 [Candidatus Woesearchaeota archaeon]|nr:hypothetical protein [Candidatus Woesearchaeota archaeon]